MAREPVGPKQAHKKGNEKFPWQIVQPLPPAVWGADTPDSYVGEDKIVEKHLGGSSPPLTDNNHDPDRDKSWVITQK